MANLREAKNLASDIDVPATGNTTVLDEVVFDRNYRRLAVEVENDGSNALDLFTIQGKTHADGAAFTLVAALGTASEVLRYTAGTLESLASGATGQALLDVEGLYSIQIIASGAAGGASVVIQGALT